MIISYRCSFFGFAIVSSCQTVLQDQATNLLHLVRLGITTSRLQIQDLLDSVPREDVVAASHAFREPKAPQQRAKLAERNRRVGSSPENACKEIISLRHNVDCTRSASACLTS